MKNRILLCFLFLAVFVVCGCNNKQMICDAIDSCKPVLEEGVTIKATNDFGTLTITADGDSRRIIEIDGITTDDKYIKFPVHVRENWGDSPSPVIGYKEGIGKFWDGERDVFIRKIDYLENEVDFKTIEEANATLKRIYQEWQERVDARVTDRKVYFSYAWLDSGLLVHWSIHQPEYWFIPSSYYVYLVVEQIYVDGKKPQGLIECPHSGSRLKIDYRTDK